MEFSHCRENAKVVGKQLSIFQHQNRGTDPCVPGGAALGLGLFNTRTNDLDDTAESVFIKSADNAN